MTQPAGTVGAKKTVMEYVGATPVIGYRSGQIAHPMILTVGITTLIAITNEQF